MRVNKHRPPNWRYFIYLIPDGRSFVTSFIREVAESAFEEKFIADFGWFVVRVNSFSDVVNGVLHIYFNEKREDVIGKHV